MIRIVYVTQSTGQAAHLHAQLGRFVVLVAGLFAAAWLAHSILVVTGGGLVTSLRGQARPGCAVAGDFTLA
jgi:hypothetical protein